jgi:hypothetical protein
VWSTEVERFPSRSQETSTAASATMPTSFESCHQAASVGARRARSPHSGAWRGARTMGARARRPCAPSAEKGREVEVRGSHLAPLMFTKQICNHSAQYLGESGPLPKRSGRVARTTEMLEEASMRIAQIAGEIPSEIRRIGNALEIASNSALLPTITGTHAPPRIRRRHVGAPRARPTAG